MSGQPGGSPRSLSVLVVEDEVLIADYIAGVLEEAGHRVAAIADSVDAALAVLERAPADVAVLDVRLKGDADGVELAAELRRRFHMPFLFISGSGDPATLRRMTAVQPLAFLQKPFRPDQLLAALRAVPG